VRVGPVAARCRELLEGTCAEKGWPVFALAVQPDPLHLFVRVWPSESAAEVVKGCKGVTPCQLREEVAHLLKLPSTWTRSYFASTAGKVRQEPLQRYIAAQTGR
jgi:putative transposase